jgi:hypothetical protein
MKCISGKKAPDTWKNDALADYFLLTHPSGCSAIIPLIARNLGKDKTKRVR